MYRVAVVSSYFPTREQPYRGHSAYRTLRQLQKWADIEVYAPFAVYPRWLTPRSFPYYRPDIDYCPPDMAAHYFEYPAVPGLSRFLNGFVCSRYLLPYLEHAKPDVILNYCLYPDGYAAVAAGKALGVPVILGAIGSDLCRIPDRATLRLTQTAVRRAAAVITVSEELRQRAIGLGAAPERVKTVLNGCDSSIFRLGDRAAARTGLGIGSDVELILYVGRLDVNKGLREMLAAASRLAIGRPRLQLAFVGEGLFRKELEDRARAAGLGGRVHLRGACDSAGVARWLNAADVFCLPSYSEGCPNVLVEALACGRPVVATAVGGIPELVTANCGILVPPRDAQQLAAALDAALLRHWNEPAIARQFCRGWDQVAAETDVICRTALAAGKPALESV
jgi:teichuronic acid biosynthesis glycosyltransferase TuaC